MRTFDIGSGDAMQQLSIENRTGSDGRTDLGRTLSYAWRHHMSIGVSYGSAAEPFTLSTERLRTLAGIGSLNQRISTVARWMTDDGFTAAFSDPTAPNGARENAIRVLDAIEEWDVRAAEAGATAHIVLDAGSNGTSGVLASAPEAITYGFDYGRSVRQAAPDRGPVLRAATPVIALPEITIRARPGGALSSETVPAAGEAAFARMHSVLPTYSGGAVTLNGLEVPTAFLANAETAQEAWNILTTTFPALSNAQLVNLMRALSSSGASIPADWQGSLRLGTTGSNTRVVELGRSSTMPSPT